jgi:hypothetical protein
MHLPRLDNLSTIPALLFSLNPDLLHLLTTSNPVLSSALESALDGLTTLLKAVAVLLSIGISFTALSLLATIPAVSLHSGTPRKAYAWSIWANLVFVSAALVFLVLGGLVAAVGAKVAEARVNDVGGADRVGAVAAKGWVALAWAGIALMVGVLLYWVGRVVAWRRARKRAAEEEKEKEMHRMALPLPRFRRRSWGRIGPY